MLVWWCPIFAFGFIFINVHPSKTSINWGFPNNGKIKELSGTSVDISLFHSPSKQQYRVQRNNRHDHNFDWNWFLKLWTKLIWCQHSRQNYWFNPKFLFRVLFSQLRLKFLVNYLPAEPNTRLLFKIRLDLWEC